MGLTTPIIVVCGQPVGFKEPTGALKCGRPGWGSRPCLIQMTCASGPLHQYSWQGYGSRIYVLYRVRIIGFDIAYLFAYLFKSVLKLCQILQPKCADRCDSSSRGTSFFLTVTTPWVSLLCRSQLCCQHYRQFFLLLILATKRSNDLIQDVLKFQMSSHVAISFQIHNETCHLLLVRSLESQLIKESPQTISELILSLSLDRVRMNSTFSNTHTNARTKGRAHSRTHARKRARTHERTHT
jgi:hypothetical protein